MLGCLMIDLKWFHFRIDTTPIIAKEQKGIHLPLKSCLLCRTQRDCVSCFGVCLSNKIASKFPSSRWVPLNFNTSSPSLIQCIGNFEIFGNPGTLFFKCIPQSIERGYPNSIRAICLRCCTIPMTNLHLMPLPQSCNVSTTLSPTNIPFPPLGLGTWHRLSQVGQPLEDVNCNNKEPTLECNSKKCN